MPFVDSFDGTRIHYLRVPGGDAMPLMVFNGFSWSAGVWEGLLEAFRGTRPAIAWDYRAHGASEPPREAANTGIADHCRDAEAILRAEGHDEVVLLGFSMGVQTTLEFYRRNPDKVRGLILLCGTYGEPLETLLGTNVVKYLFPYVYNLVQSLPLPVVKTIWRGIFDTNLSYLSAKHFFLNGAKASRDQFLTHFSRHVAGIDPKVYFELARKMATHTARDVLETISVPTLVIIGGLDNFTPPLIGRTMHMKIAGSRLEEIPDGSHAVLIEQPDRVRALVQGFLEEHWPAD